MALSITSLSGFGGLANQAPSYSPPTYIGISSDESGTLTYPTSQSGDLLVAFISHVNVVHSTPSGWTLIGSQYTSTDWSYRYAVYYRVRAAETTLSYSVANGGAICIAFRGGNSTVSAIGTWSETANTSIAYLSGITPTRADSVLVGYVSDRDPGGGIAAPGGWTTRLNSSFTYFSNSVGTKTSGSTSPTGTITWNAYSVSYSANSVLLEIT
jgi:hypothetical protein